MEAKARELIGKMTVQEKISQLMNEAAGIPRLGIKPYNWWNEALHGVGRDGRATVFPQPICTASSFDPQLIHDIGEAISTEGRAKYLVAQRLENYSIYAGLTFWSPNINIFRDPRWGRGMETYGEDPFLTGTMGTAFVRGMQGDDPVYERVASCAKHLAVHSGPESTRHSADIHPLRRDLFETYLPAFRMLVQEGKVEAVMSAYNSVYGESCSGSRFLLTDVLRNQWKFGGHIVSDCGAVADIYQGHAIAKTPAEAAAIALKAGLNLECGTTFTALQEAYDKGMVTDADLDRALQPLLMTRLRLGILEPDADCPYNNIPESVICSPQHRSLARRAALEGMVLLKNDSLLPLSKDIRTLYLLGPAATDTYYLMGNYYGLSDHYSSYLQGIIGKVSNGTSVNYKPAFNASYPNRNDMDWSTGEAMAADVVVAFLGINSNLEGEEGEAIESGTRGDRVGLSLPESQMAYFRKLAKARAYRPNCKLVTVVCGGSPVDLSEIAAGSDAVVMAWYTGQEGGDALADLLFGDASFSGRLPITFPKSVDKLPPFDDYSMQGRTYKYMTDNIDYPFGYGLTYGKISYSAATATYAKSGLRVTAQVSNAAAKPVDETVQVYLSTPGAGLTSPLSSLVAFRRVRLEGGETQTVSFDIAPERLLTVQTDGTSRLLRGEYTVTVGGAAPSKRTAELGVSTVQAHFAVRR
ncbi:MAG: glycoside hydrolase family 3 C-terminal domain-containing protein [Prevotella sp.]|nr:glycoside hydrolase family 3 C-terminal domain-containing protein [Prevotella sp.]